MKEPNQNEVNIRASITGSSLSVGAKSRAISAIDRLVGGLLGIPAAWFERIESDIRNRSFMEDKIIETATDKLSEVISHDEKIAKAVAEIALRSIYDPPRYARTIFRSGRDRLLPYIRPFDGDLCAPGPDGMRAGVSLSI